MSLLGSSIHRKVDNERPGKKMADCLAVGSLASWTQIFIHFLFILGNIMYLHVCIGMFVLVYKIDVTPDKYKDKLTLNSITSNCTS